MSVLNFSFSFPRSSSIAVWRECPKTVAPFTLSPWLFVTEMHHVSRRRSKAQRQRVWRHNCYESSEFQRLGSEIALPRGMCRIWLKPPAGVSWTVSGAARRRMVPLDRLDVGEQDVQPRSLFWKMMSSLDSFGGSFSAVSKLIVTSYHVVCSVSRAP